MGVVTHLVIVVLSVTCVVDSARILGVFPIPAPSHIILGNRYMHELAARGHQVTYITPLPQKKNVPNLTELSIEDSLTEMAAMQNRNLFDMDMNNAFFSVYFVGEMGYKFTRLLLENPNVKALLESNAKFDLVVIENFCNEAHYGFGHRFNAPVIAFGTVGASPWTNPLVANPSPLSHIPNFFLNYGPNMSFKQRVVNTVFSFYEELFSNVYVYRRHNALMKEHFPDAPELSVLKYNTSLVFVNSHVSTSIPVPHVPNMIEIGGFHVQPPKALPKDLQDYLDGAKDGVVYFSMGSNLRSTLLPAEKREAILRVFSKLKQKVLWKWEDDELPGKPPNVKIGKWLPQQDILAHPNVKLFITHGGLLSTVEAIYHGVPLIGIPIFGDQKMNIANAVNSGYALAVPFNMWSEETLTNALNEILNNPKYAQNAKLRSKIMNDQPLKPLDSAMYWTEYVLRHQGAYHLRSGGLDLYWHQYMLLDVALFLILDVIVIFIVLYMVCSKLCGKKKTDVSETTKKSATQLKKKN